MLWSLFVKSPSPPQRDTAPLPIPDRRAFDRLVLAGDQDCLALFGAAWCRSSRRAAERLARLADRGSLTALAVDREALPELARRYRVTGIPAVLHFRKGQVGRRRIGEPNDDDLGDWLAVSGLQQR
jgi:thioredoxin-like negative regulator of GroEL